MPVEIRKARVSDIDALTALENAVFDSDRISRRSFRLLIERETAQTLVAEADGRIAGYAIVLYRKGSGVARLYSLATGPDFTGQGVGRALIEAAEDKAFDHGRMLLRLEVREDNFRAIGIYEKGGYRKIGREPDYYEDGQAALLVFAYATLSVRRLFKGEFIGLWSGLGQWETYSYSALWLVMGVVLLTLGVWQKSQILRIASAALISVAVLKVFLFDMSELEGVLRALSFIGLGAVLIGIGLFYQRLLTRAARAKNPAG
jgi:ribosomal protein S18 acetylase RimI-like enzyme